MDSVLEVVGGVVKPCVRAVSAPKRVTPSGHVRESSPKGAGIGGEIPERLSGSFESFMQTKTPRIYIRELFLQASTVGGYISNDIEAIG